MTGPPYLTIIAGHRCGHPVLLLAGELDLSNHQDLRSAVRTVLDQQEPGDLTIDLTGLAFTDCAGLSILVWAHERLAERGRRLTLTGAQPSVLRLIRLTSLDKRLNLAETGRQERGAGADRFDCP